MIRTLELGGLVLPVGAAHELEQTYEPFGGWALLRMMSGAGIKQTHWAKLRTKVSGGGVAPPGLQALDYSAPMTLKCAAVRAIASASNVIVLPAARRTDTGYEPYGLAQLSGGDLVYASCSLAGDTATLGIVAGAVAYLAHYWPQLTVIADPPAEHMDVRGAAPGWDLTAEEL